MADDFHAKYAARQAHLAAVPLALEALRNAVIDFNGQPMQDGEQPIDCINCAHLRTVVAEVERLQSLVKQQQKEANEAERSFSREAREIASEARWMERNEQDGVPYGTY